MSRFKSVYIVKAFTAHFWMYKLHAWQLWTGNQFRQVSGLLTSQKNSFPLSPQNQEIHDTSSELLISEHLQWDMKTLVYDPAIKRRIHSVSVFKLWYITIAVPNLYSTLHVYFHSSFSIHSWKRSSTLKILFFQNIMNCSQSLARW